MQLDENSEIVMITSAGCNALDYLLDNPRQINCIDVNPRQNALLRLKIATFQGATHENLFALFGKGVHPEVEALYEAKLRPFLPEYAQKYWDKNLNYFNGRGIRKSFYHYGTSGTFAWMTNKYLKAHKNLYKKVQKMFDAETLERQTELYYDVERKVINRLMEWVMNRHFVMSLVGVPRSQQLLFIDKYERGALGYVQECLRKVFTKLTLQDNYFYRLYVNGAYTESCCPSYLEKENFSVLQQRANRIQNYNTTISQFLIHHPKPYSHYVLLDHQDWLAANNRAALEEEWRLILQNSRPGTKILLRSAAHEIDFFPNFVLDAVMFEQQKTQETHERDRVGTYASVYLAIVK
jgi:S-adenosylmethionine-diacylglycerol 3-amino-3-carboxypropyl transferase